MARSGSSILRKKFGSQILSEDMQCILVHNDTNVSWFIMTPMDPEDTLLDPADAAGCPAGDVGMDPGSTGRSSLTYIQPRVLGLH